MKNFFIIATLVLTASIFTACNDYGNKVSKKHIDIYYREGISKEEAIATAGFIYGIDSASQNDMSKRKSMQLAKNGDTVIFRMVVDEKKLNKVNSASFILLGMMMSKGIFKNSPVNIDFTDNRFNTIRTVRNTIPVKIDNESATDPAPKEQ